MSAITLTIEFSGGLEKLFDSEDKKEHVIELRSKVPVDNSTNEEATEMKDVDLSYLVLYLRDQKMKERKELFVENGTV
jgi:ubiquitin related modifier 1